MSTLSKLKNDIEEYKTFPPTHFITTKDTHTRRSKMMPMGKKFSEWILPFIMFCWDERAVRELFSSV
jgi:hypothetical protein